MLVPNQSEQNRRHTYLSYIKNNYRLSVAAAIAVVHESNDNDDDKNPKNHIKIKAAEESAATSVVASAVTHLKSSFPIFFRISRCQCL